MALPEETIKKLQKNNYTAEELANKLGISRNHLGQCLKAGKFQLGQYKKGMYWFIPRKRVEEWEASPEYLKWKGLGEDELLEEYKHFASIIPPGVAARRLENIYGCRNGYIHELLAERELA